jgi:hypothetical protein
MQPRAGKARVTAAVRLETCSLRLRAVRYQRRRHARQPTAGEHGQVTGDRLLSCVSGATRILTGVPQGEGGG